MDDVSPWVTTFGIMFAAAVASGGTILGSRWSHRNERFRLRNELVTIFGNDRDSMAQAAQKAQTRSNEVDAELERVRDERRAIADEFAVARIAYREALAEKDDAMRAALSERDAQRRQVEISLGDCRAQLAEIERELIRCRDEVTRRGAMIEAQSTVVSELRTRIQAMGGS